MVLVASAVAASDFFSDDRWRRSAGSVGRKDHSNIYDVRVGRMDKVLGADCSRLAWCVAGVLGSDAGEAQERSGWRCLVEGRYDLTGSLSD